MTPTAQSLSLSLISHTNAGKTTLARTLLQRDIGEVRDAPHVTDESEQHPLLRTEAGDVLWLWDTPGFGDSVRLVQRLRRDGTLLGWFLGEVWDRWRDRPFWSSQQALRQVRDRTDLVLYLINASERPEAAAHVDAEMALLDWMGRPVIVLLNQLGLGQDPDATAEDIERWRAHLTRHAPVRTVLALDAFSRCWVQEGVLWQAVEALLDGSRRDGWQRLQAAWWAQRVAVFDQSVQTLADSLADQALVQLPLEGGASRWTGALRDWARRRLMPEAPADGRDSGADPTADAAAPSNPRGDALQARLLQAVETRLAAELAALLRLHGLSGQAADGIQQQVGRLVEWHVRIDEKGAAAWGGAVTGALAGLKADLATGGLTLGGGLLAGGLIGALAGMGVARGVNTVRGGGPPWAGLSAEALDTLVEAALLRYLAVAHFGRGRGDWQRDPTPQHWLDDVRRAWSPHRGAVAALWAARPTVLDAAAVEAARGTLSAALVPHLRETLRAVLLHRYPEAAAQWGP
jgi:hypothetical protein